MLAPNAKLRAQVVPQGPEVEKQLTAAAPAEAAPATKHEAEPGDRQSGDLSVSLPGDGPGLPGVLAGAACTAELCAGQVKEIVPARHGFKTIVKHMPGQAFAMNEQIYRRLGRRFEAELALWGASDDIHMVMIATFGVTSTEVPAVQELCLMPVTRQWLPVEDGFDRQLVERLVGEGRSFVKGLRYALARDSALASVTLTDCDGTPPLLFVIPAGIEDGARFAQIASPSTPVWTWRPSIEQMPALPARRKHHDTRIRLADDCLPR